MSRPQHAIPAVDAIVDDEEIILSRELMFVYTVHASLGRCAAQAVAGWDQTGILQSVSSVSLPVSTSGDVCNVGDIHA